MHLLSPLVLHRVTPLDLAQPQLSTPLQHGCPPRLAPAQASADVGCQSRVGFGLLWVSCSRAGQAGGKAGRPPGRRWGGGEPSPGCPAQHPAQVPLRGRVLRGRFCKTPRAEGSRAAGCPQAPAPPPPRARCRMRPPAGKRPALEGKRGRPCCRGWGGCGGCRWAGLGPKMLLCTLGSAPQNAAGHPGLSPPKCWAGS